MLPFFDVRQHAHGVIAIGQFATGFIAIGQVAVGVVAIGQAAAGVVVIGQGSIGVASIGMITLGLGRALGMVAMSTVHAVGLVAMGWQARGPAAWSLRPPPRSPPRELTPLTDLQQIDGQEGWIRVRTQGSGDSVSWWAGARAVPLTWDPTADGEPERLRGELVIRLANAQGRLVATAAEPAARSSAQLAINGVAMLILSVGSLAAFGLLVVRPLIDGLH